MSNHPHLHRVVTSVPSLEVAELQSYSTPLHEPRFFFNFMAVLFSYVGQQSFVLTRLPSWLKTRVKIVLASFLFHTRFLLLLFFSAAYFIDSICFYMNCGVCWCIIHPPPALDDHKPTVGTRGPRRPNHKHVWIYLCSLEFISRSLPRPVFLLDAERDVLSRVPSEIVGSLPETMESCGV